MRAVANILVLVASGLLFLINSATADDPLDPKKPKKQPRRPRVQVTISKETTRITKPLRADGYVDYVEALNQRASKGVTPENNAAVLFWRAMGPKEIEKATSKKFYKLLGIEPLAAEGDYFISFDDHLEKLKLADVEEDREKEIVDEFDRAAQRPWSKKDCPLIAGWLAANERPLRLVVEGTRRPHCYWPLVGSEESTDVISAMMPGVQESREFTRALRARAMLRAGSGRIDDAWADLMSSHRLARHISRGPSLVDALVGMALEQITCQADAALANHVDLSAKHAKRFAVELVKLPPLDGLASKYDVAERYMFLDAVRIVVQEGAAVISQMSGESDKSVGATLERLAANAFVDWDYVLKMGNSWYDRLAAAARQPTRAGRRKAMGKIIDDIDETTKQTKDVKTVLSRIALGESPRKLVSETMGNLFVALLLPATFAIDNAADKATARLNLTRLAFALAAYKAEHGSYPMKLADLSPKYLANVPTDVFSAADFRYRAVKGGYRLWSIGPNGRDDDGEEPDLENYEGDGDDLLIAAPR